MTDMPQGSEQAPQSADQSDPSPVVSGPNRFASDRALGILCLALGIWYVLETRNFVLTAFTTGPIGPKTLPILLGIAFVGLALILIFKPDESPDWGTFAVWSRLAAVVTTSFLYGQVLQLMGFIVASTVLSIVIGLFFRGPIRKLVPLSLGFTIAVAFVFNNWLELRLPPGWWGGF
ncbi:MAG: tripartite tricarboxylate transporter TctB family protein [Acidobacteria bacterium]|nr:tripartite tricarboxylate transporter TctB family protein [Acidobacteriota bacterium]